jgi:Tfp pilus assembly protein PilF
MTDLVQRAIQLREAQQIEAAYGVMSEAAQQSPADPRAAFGLAQISFESWRPAADLFAKARLLVPENPDIVRNHALALSAEGQVDVAQELLSSMLDRHPAWLDGHRTLASMRLTNGVERGFDQSYAQACMAEPGNVSVRLAWFHLHAIRKDWIAAQSVLDGASDAIRGTAAFAKARLFIAAESGDPDFDGLGFAAFADSNDPGLDLCQLRYRLRHGEVEVAEAIAARQIYSKQGRNFWPYLSLCWRLNDDARAEWLDRAPVFNQSFDLAFSDSELSELAGVLRSLHRLKAPYPEQSVRGGTQTDRQLFFHPDPAIQATRTKIAAAVRQYVDGLSTAQAGHPLLDSKRDAVQFEGSWSVRLSGAGYHASHTHCMAWLSSAFYVALPTTSQLGPEPAGWLTFGTPPPELKLELEPYGRVEPAPGRLAIFPATMWHSTEPFTVGERLSIAFDVQVAGQE